VNKQLEVFKKKVFEIAKDNNQDPESVWRCCEIIPGETISGIEAFPKLIIRDYDVNTFLVRDITLAFEEFLALL
jgi:hypothetical protein